MFARSASYYTNVEMQNASLVAEEISSAAAADEPARAARQVTTTLNTSTSRDLWGHVRQSNPRVARVWGTVRGNIFVPTLQELELLLRLNFACLSLQYYRRLSTFQAPGRVFCFDT